MPASAQLSLWTDEEPSSRTATNDSTFLDNMRQPVHRWFRGTGAVESANKLVVEERMKGPGMHWREEHVNPMLALRGAECSGRWDEAWAITAAALRKARTENLTRTLFA